MSCFFCDLDNHVSHNCSIYVSDSKRKEIIRRKNCCCSCLSACEAPNCYSSNRICDLCFSLTNQHAEYCLNQTTVSNVPNCRNCSSNQKCFICFSKEHHTVFCPDRLKVINVFPPNIDKDIILRFLQLLTNDEKYLLCLSSPAYFNLFEVKHFKVTFRKEIYGTTIRNVLDADIVVANKAHIGDNSRSRNFFNDPSAGSIGLLSFVSFRIKSLEIYRSPLSSIEFLQLLSSKTKTLKCCAKIEFLPPQITFQQILQKAPNLEYIDIHQTNIVVDITWPDDLLQYSHAAQLKFIHLKIGAEFNFYVESLVILMKKKRANIFLTIEVPPSGIAIDQIIKDKLSIHFKKYIFNSHSLTIIYVDSSVWQNVIATEKYEIKNVY